MESRIEVESIEGLDWTMQEILTRKPVIVIDHKAFMVVPLKANVGQITTFVGQGKEIQIRMKPLEIFTKPA